MTISRKIYLLYGAIFLGVSSTGLIKAGTENFSRGKELAESLCSVCHEVGNVPSTSPKTEIPSFVSIANRPGQTQEKIVGSIIFPHPEMPRVSFTNKDLKDLSLYILSLKYKK